jgi:hypothetical protein
MSFVKASGSISTNPCPVGVYSAKCLPNLYNQNSTLQLQGVLIGALVATGLTSDQLLVLNLNKYKPLNVEITTFTYYKDDTSLDNPTYPGVPPTLDGSEYYEANRVDFTYQFVIMGLNASNVSTDPKLKVFV